MIKENVSTIKVDDHWFVTHKFAQSVYPCDGTDHLGNITTGTLKLFTKYAGEYGTSSYKFIRVEHHNTTTKNRRGKVSRSNWYMLSASGNGMAVTGKVNYRKYLEEDIINVLKLVGLCTE